MARTNDDITGFSDLFKKSTDPRQAFTTDVLKGETSSPYGILAKGVAGAMLGRQAGEQQAAAVMQQQQDLQERMRVAQILQDHEERKLDDDFSFKSMLQEYTRTGNKLYLNMATKLKPSVAKSGDKTMQLSRLANAKRTLITTKYGGVDLMDEASLLKANQDPEIMWINKQIEEIVSGKEAVSGASPTSGARQDTNQDVNGFEDVARLAQTAKPEAEPEKVKKERPKSPFGATRAKKYSAEIEQDIADNMKHHKKPRSQVIAAMKKKGIIT